MAGRKLQTPGETTTTETEVDTSNVPTSDAATLNATTSETEAEQAKPETTTSETEVGQMSPAEMQAMILSLQKQVAQQKRATIIPVAEQKTVEQRSRVVLGKHGWTREYY